MRLVVIAFGSAGIEADGPSINQGHLTVVAGQGHLPFQLVRKPDIILIEKRDPLAASQIYRPLTRLAESHSFFRAHVPDAAIGIPRERVGAAVSRAVVPYDQFPIAERLRQYAIDRLGQRGGAVQHVDDYTHQGHREVAVFARSIDESTVGQRRRSRGQDYGRSVIL